MTRIKFYITFFSITFLGIIALFVLTSSIFAQPTNNWKIERDSINNLNFYLNSNGLGGSSLQLTTAGHAKTNNLSVRKIYDVDDATNTFYLDPNASSNLKDLNLTGNLTQNGLPFSTSQWTTSGTNIYYNTGNVGIGTATPGNLLTVASNPGTSATVSRISHTGTASTPGTALQVSNGYGIVNGSYEVFGVYGNNFGTNYLTVKDNGAVGIGTNTPTGKLQVIVPAYTNRDTDAQQLVIGSGASGGCTPNPGQSGVRIGYNDAGPGNFYGVINAIKPCSAWGTLTLQEGGGSVGIGTTSAYAPLDIYVNGAAADVTGGGLMVARYQNSATDIRGGAIYSRYIAGQDAMVFGVTTVAGKNPYSDFDQARMTILSNANVGIGRTDPQTKLHIKQVSDTWGGGLRLERTAGNWSEIITGSDNNLYFGINGVAVWCSMTTSATVGCTSDGRLKKNIKPLTESGLDIISKLKPSTFDFTKNDAHSAGFIAQDVLEILPGAVIKNATDGYYSLSDSYFTPYIVKGTQELDYRTKEMQNQIDSLADQVKSQKAEIELLKKEIEALKIKDEK